MFCRRCGNKLEDDWNVCPNCGELQKQESMQKHQSEPLLKKWRFWMVSVVVFLGVIVIFLGSLLILGTRESESTDSSETESVSSKENIIEEKLEAAETAEPKKKSAASQLFIARNEIFARHGYIFEMEELKTHFEGTSWYQGIVPGSQFDADAELNDFEKKNADLIKKVENESENQKGNQQSIQENYFSIPAGTYVNNQIFPEWQALVNVNYASVDWFEVTIFTDPYMNAAVFYGGKTDEKTIQVTAEGTGIALTLHWDNEREMTVTRSGEFTGTDSGIFDDMTNTNYTLAYGF